MYQIQNLTSDPIQQQSLVLPDNTIIQISIYFCLLQIGWFISNLQYGTFQLQGMRITNSPNMLIQYQNQIPFGLACFSAQDLEPMQIQSFSSGSSNLYILDAAEVAYYQSFLEGSA